MCEQIVLALSSLKIYEWFLLVILIMLTITINIYQVKLYRARRMIQTLKAKVCKKGGDFTYK